MSVKSKARQTRRAKPESTAPARANRAKKHVPVKAVEKRAAGEIMSALLNAITFGALEPAPPSRA
jgi:hypothetical protein